uniref:Xylulose kinase n=1 Tax=Globisporangium ultimum (strain ATCC 200006 / CBS 805.95 / DAOM BR144) TaxID=431595 RepID=K3WGU8_GLOUD
MTTQEAHDALFLGFDCSTQSMTAVITNVRGDVVHECAFRFDEKFPQYGTTNGVLRLRDVRNNEMVVIPSLLFVDALDAVLGDLAASGKVKLSAVKSISGSAQQHASVYWAKEFSLQESLNAADPSSRLVDVLKSYNQKSPFYLEHGPSWMDSSTTMFCEALEKELGGVDRVAQISGSRAYERFTGNQIAKRIHDDPEFLNQVGRIALVSSMLTSLLCGEYTPIDESDGSGMNLLDVRARQWSPELLKATAKFSPVADAPKLLEAALGSAVAKPYNTIGHVHPYFQKKFGFSPECVVVPFSGDNPCSLAGIGLSKSGDVGVSLGTSSTLMAVVPTDEARTSGQEGHFFSNPIDPYSLMAMICFKNGSLTRQEVRDHRANKSWDDFDVMLKATQPGNDGVVGFYFSDPEITPSTAKAGVISFDASDAVVDLQVLSSEVEVRAVVESQFLSLRLHAERLGVAQPPQRLIVVGGASSNTSMLQVLANVFNAPVYRLTCATNSAALGGAFRAQHGLACAQSPDGSFVAFEQSAGLDFALAATPDAAVAQLYTSMLPRFEMLEARAVALLS